MHHVQILVQNLEVIFHEATPLVRGASPKAGSAVKRRGNSEQAEDCRGQGLLPRNLRKTISGQILLLNQDDVPRSYIHLFVNGCIHSTARLAFK